jgi:hypothetical protein
VIIAKQNSEPKDSQGGYLGIEMRTFGCKFPSTKNEGMAERWPVDDKAGHAAKVDD